jgi:trans-aconitate 2-methyltransferase
MTSWDPAQYERYKAYRERPAMDLLARLPADLQPRAIIDLGCGTGEQAAWLARRWPQARVAGVDTSPDMLARARARPERVDWVEADIAQWAPDAPVDLIYTNAALQWLSGHEALVPRLAGFLAEGGVFACQVPMTHDTAWHRQLRDTAAEARWAGPLADVSPVRPVLSGEATTPCSRRSAARWTCGGRSTCTC